MSAVLVVDDSLTVRMDLTDALEQAGLRVVAASSLDEARARLRDEDFGVVILDVILPDGDGIDLLREIRAGARAQSTHVVLLSSEAEVADRVRGLKTGADDYVGKPYDASYIIARTHELLRASSGVGEGVGILVIDDSLTFRTVIGRWLERAGYVVHVATTGEDGLRAAAAVRPSAVVVDSELPGIDGRTVIRRIRLDAALRATPCLMLTGSDASDAELGALDAGADAFERKGADPGVILAKLATLLRRGDGAAMRPASLHGPTKVLAVDDSPAFLEMIGATLRAEGLDVALARSGEEALELLAVTPVGCVLLDMIMPGIDGHETCRRIKAAPGLRETPVILLAGRDDRTAMLEGLAAGADDYISKSSDRSILTARVRAQLRRRQLEDEDRRFREQILQNEVAAAEARAARELAAARAAHAEELERKNKELEAFSYSVSHDLRAPLRSIDGFSKALLEDSSDRLDEVGKQHLDRVLAATKRMAELIDDLLELARVGRLELRRGTVDMSRLAREVLTELAAREPDRRIEVLVAPDLVAEGDPRLLKIVLENLMSNAWKFTQKTAAPRIELFEEARGPRLTAFCVRDNGAGFDMKYKERLFNAFQRLHEASEFPGTGVGLTTVQRIVERHGGRVAAEGAVLRGATFSFTLPVPERP